jgi:hypothetical protein
MSYQKQLFMTIAWVFFLQNMAANYLIGADNYYDEDQCPVCKNDFDSLTQRAILACRHVLCEECLLHIKVSETPRCPLCRIEFPNYRMLKMCAGSVVLVSGTIYLGSLLVEPCQTILISCISSYLKTLQGW